MGCKPVGDFVIIGVSGIISGILKTKNAKKLELEVKQNDGKTLVRFDIDLENKVIHIRRTLTKDVAAKVIMGETTKTYNSTRDIKIDELTESMEKAISETNRRRKIQEEYNKKHGIIPQTIIKEVTDEVSVITKNTDTTNINVEKLSTMSKLEKHKLIEKLETQMKKAAKELNFEEAMMLRDAILEIKADMR